MSLITTETLRKTVLALSLAAAGAASVIVARAQAIRPEPVRLADTQTAAVTIKAYKYDPQTLEVKVGTTVTWTNQDAKTHTVNSGTPDDPKAGPLNGELDEGKTYTYTFKEVGEFPYYCKNHRGMRGKVIVK